MNYLYVGSLGTGRPGAPAEAVAAVGAVAG